jgi:Icc protein
MPTAAPLRVIHITDFHLKTTPGSRPWGVDVDAGLSAVLACIQERHPQPDFILATGDLVGDEPEAYDRVREFLEPIGVPVYCLPGNHDFPARMAQTLRRRPGPLATPRHRRRLADRAAGFQRSRHAERPSGLWRTGVSGYRAGTASRTANAWFVSTTTRCPVTRPGSTP